MAAPLTTYERFPLRLIEDETGEVRVESRDLPGLLTWGRTRDEAVSEGADALEVLVSGLMAAGEAVPAPSARAEGEVDVVLPPLLGARLALWAALGRSGLTIDDLAGRLAIPGRDARRLFDTRHRTTLEALQMAADALGGRLVIGWAPHAA